METLTEAQDRDYRAEQRRRFSDSCADQDRQALAAETPPLHRLYTREELDAAIELATSPFSRNIRERTPEEMIRKLAELATDEAREKLPINARMNVSQRAECIRRAAVSAEAAIEVSIHRFIMESQSCQP